MTKVRFLKNQLYSIHGNTVEQGIKGQEIDLPDHSLKSLFDVGAIEIVMDEVKPEPKPVVKEQKIKRETKQLKTKPETKKGKGKK